jgi:transcription initiation factor TFIID subunit TAF12
LLAEQQAARDAAEKKRLQDEADQLQQDKERMLREEKAKQQLMEKLRSIGKCPAGFTWTKTSSGYVCAGGSHHVSDHQL